MAKAITKVLTVVVVFILVLLIINLIGDYVADELPDTGQKISNILHSAWNAIQRIIQPAGYGYGH